MRRLPLDAEHRPGSEAAGRALPGRILARLADPAVALDRRLWRRALALTAVVVGALLIWLSPEQLIGVVTLIAGLALEAIGIRLDHA